MACRYPLFLLVFRSRTNLELLNLSIATLGLLTLVHHYFGLLILVPKRTRIIHMTTVLVVLHSN